MQTLTWYWNRLGRMSLGEVGHRVRGAAVSRAQRAGLLGAHRVPRPAGEVPRLDWFATVPLVDPEPYLVAAERVAQGWLPLFELGEVRLGIEPRWNRCAKTGREAPLLFGKALDYRNEALVGDIKYLWEPSRHLQLVVLAQAWRLGGGDHLLDALRRQLDSWIEQCPYPLGPHWSSSLEAGIRLINWAIVWQLTGGVDGALFRGPGGDALRERFLDAVYRQAHFIAGHPSRFSSANNHLIGEAAGLLVAATVWPLWSESARWADRGYSVLAREALAQNAPDGINREQTTAYQQFVLDFLLLAGLCSRAAGRDFPPAYWERIARMLEATAALMDVAGRVPMLGDADDGYVVRLDPDPAFCPYRSLLATGAALFGRRELRAKAGALDDKSRWLLGDERARGGFEAAAAAAARPLPRRFPQGGWYILGNALDTPSELRVLVDAAPLGYLSIAAHGHADALSLLLSMEGLEFLVDPGTYAYHTQAKWRDYFRGTSAHNTVRVDGQDQSVSGGNFMWVRHARAACEHWRDEHDVAEFVGSHDGYLRLPEPVTHRRRVRLAKAHCQVEVTDRLDGQGVHEVERFWHFAEACHVRLEGSTVVAENEGLAVRLIPGEEVEAHLLFGSEEPPGGWVSRRFDVKVPAATVVWRCRASAGEPLRTTIECGV